MTTIKVLLGSLVSLQFAANVLASPYTLPPGNLLRNESFNDGFSSWVGTYGITTTPYTLLGPNVGVVTDIWSSSVGQCLTQTFPTDPGATYQIMFGIRLPELYEVAPGIWVPVNGDSSGSPTTIDLQWNGTTLESIPVTTRDWVIKRYEVVADATSTSLTFFNGPGSRAWPYVDGVYVGMTSPAPSVPDGGSGAILIALGSLAFYRRHRSSTAG